MTNAVARAPSAGRVAPETLAAVRQGVRQVLEQSAGWAEAPPELRQRLARRLVEVGAAGARLLEDEQRVSEALAAPRARAAPSPETAASTAPVASSLNAPLSTAAVDAAAPTLRNLRDAVDFPTFVTSLISGVFESITKSSVHQMERLVDLLDNVSTSAEGFITRNIGDDDARAWLTGRFPFIRRGEGGLTVAPETDLQAQKRVLRDVLQATDQEIARVSDADLEESLLPLARRQLGRERQSMLATLVKLGLQRVVVDEGRLHASMELRVDARSYAERLQQERNDLRVNAAASANYGLGPWGVSAQVSTSIGRVQSDQQHSQQELQARAGLRSSVDLAFRTEQVPLDRMADPGARARIDANSRVPMDLGATTTNTRTLTPAQFGDVPATPTAPTPPAPGSNPAPTTPAATPAATPPASTPAPTPAASPTPAAGQSLPRPSRR